MNSHPQIPAAITVPCPLSDEAVVGRVLQGETGLYEVLMRRYNQRLYRIVRAMLLDDDEAEDVVQDAYVRAYAALNQFEGRASFATWLTKIAIHEASCRARKQGRISDIPNPAGQPYRGMEDMRSTVPSPEEQTLRSETRSLLEHAVDSLPDIYRSVFMLREIENLSTAETAACLDLSEDAVKVRLLRARHFLREELYERTRATSAQSFAFLGVRCDRMVRNVLERIEQDPNTPR